MENKNSQTNSPFTPASNDQAEVPRLLHEIDSLKTQLQEQRAGFEQEIESLNERIRLLHATLFGKKSEKKGVDPALQPSLFTEAEETAPVTPEKEVETTVKAHSRGKPGRRPLSADLPRVDVIIDLPAAEKVSENGLPMVCIGQEVSERLDITPPKIQVIRTIRLKYAPPVSDCEIAEGAPGEVKIAPLPPQIIPQGIVTPGLLAWVIIAKFMDAIPLPHRRWP